MEPGEKRGGGERGPGETHRSPQMIDDEEQGDRTSPRTGGRSRRAIEHQPERRRHAELESGIFEIGRPPQNDQPPGDARGAENAHAAPGQGPRQVERRHQRGPDHRAAVARQARVEKDRQEQREPSQRRRDRQRAQQHPAEERDDCDVQSGERHDVIDAGSDERLLQRGGQLLPLPDEQGRQERRGGRVLPCC